MRKRVWFWLALLPLPALAAGTPLKASYFEVLGKPAYADCAAFSGHSRLAAVCEAAVAHHRAYEDAAARGTGPAELERIYAMHQQAVEYLVGFMP